MEINKVDMTVKIAGVTLRNPVITASGTCGYGKEYAPYYMPDKIGAVTVKALTLEPRMGNPPPRIAETPSGIINSIGLQNPGVRYFVKNELGRLKKLGAVVIANIAGETIEEYCAVAEILSQSEVDLLELNISCPNVEKGGVAFGVDPAAVEKITSEVKRAASKPLIVKLSPNVADITVTAKAAENGGADALSMINTLLGMRFDLRTRRPVLANKTGGLSGPAIFPVALRMVWQTRAKTALPIIGMGGIATAEDAAEMMIAGADAVAVGTAAFMNPYAPSEIAYGLEKFCEQNGLDSVGKLTGSSYNC